MTGASDDGQAGVTEADIATRLQARTVETSDGCWIWQGARSSGGYASVLRNRKGHRVMYELAKGAIPEGMDIDHTCENPPCINPAHLDAVTRAEHNRRTMERRGKPYLWEAAADLRKQGKSLQEIADALGYTTIAGAWSAVQYAVDRGMVASADLPKQKRLTTDEREAILRARESGEPTRQIAERFGIAWTHVYKVCKHAQKIRDERSAA